MIISGHYAPIPSPSFSMRVIEKLRVDEWDHGHDIVDCIDCIGMRRPIFRSLTDRGRALVGMDQGRRMW